MTLAATPLVARADPPAPVDAPVLVQLTGDATAPDGTLRTTNQLVVQPRIAPAVDAKIALTFAAGEGNSDANASPWAGVSPFSPYAWNKAGVAVQAAWSGIAGTKLQLDASDEMRNQSFVGPAALNSHPMSQQDAQAAGLKATADLGRGFNLTLGAGVGADDGTVDLVEDSTLVRRVALADEQGELTSLLAWTVTPKLSFEVGDKLVSRTISYGDAALADDHVALEPHAAAVLKPIAGAEWSLSLEHATSPLQASTFAALAEAAQSASLPMAASDRLRPDETWSVKAAVAQKFHKTGTLKLAFTHADLKSSTEMVELAPGVQAPGSVTGGQRQQVDAALNMPLEMIGLKGMSLESSGVVRHSDIPDPITGVMRAPSGETPYEAKVNLVAELPRNKLRLGVQGQATGPQSVYSLNRVDEVSISPSVGAFVEYRPSDLALRLQLDDLAGADRRYVSTLYGASRDGPVLGETDREVPGGAGFSLSLRRQF